MAVNLNAVSLLNTFTAASVSAPLIEGTVAATIVTQVDGHGPRFTTASAQTGRQGFRVVLPSALNFSGYDWRSFTILHSQSAPADRLDSVENGGIRMIFIDAAGNYAGYNLYGLFAGVVGSSPRDGFLTPYTALNYVWHIAADRAPDISSGVINWAEITAYELTSKTITPWKVDGKAFRFCKRNVPVITGTETFASISAVNDGSAVAIKDPLLLQSAPKYYFAASQVNFNIRIGLAVGNGSTTTNFTDTDFAVCFENPFELAAEGKTNGPWVQVGPSRLRPFRVNQSATDVLSLTDGSIASAGWWQWELSGSGTATCTRVQFWRFNGFRSAHGNYIDCEWNGAPAPVEVTAATVITGGRIRSATATGLKITGPAKAYTDISTSLNNPAAAYDIELGSGGAGTYELPGITVPSGYTLKLRNDSASNAVVVKIPLGIAYTTSTAGGAITVEIPEVSVTVEASALISGSRVQLYNVSDGVEMLNTVLASAGLTYTALYTGNKIVRLRADHASKLPLETAGVLTPSGLTFLDVQIEDDVYLGNGIDGGLVTEFAPDGANVQVDINDLDGVTNIQRLYAWLQWYMTTTEGVGSAFFGAVTALDSANYLIDNTKADITLDNVGLLPVRVVGGYLYRRDGLTVIAPLSNSIQMDPGKAYAIETGVSGLTGDESNKLNAISTLALESTAQAIKVDAATLVARPAPVVPTAAEVTAAVWADPAADALALEATVQQVLAAEGVAGTKLDVLVARPAAADAATPTQVADAVWQHLFVSKLLTVAKFLGLK